MGRKNPIELWDSEPIENYVFNKFSDRDKTRVSDQLLYLQRVSGLHGDAVKFMNFALGKHLYTYTGSVRNYIWENKNSRHRWRAFASKRGLSLEVERDVEPDVAEWAWGLFTSDIGLAWRYDPVVIPSSYQYNCPGCKKQVKTFQIGNSISYLVKERQGDRFEEHECGYKGHVEATGAIRDDK